MGKRLAIKGHPTRGWEIIDILKMMGGVNGKINRRNGRVYNIYNGDYFIYEIGNTREVAYYIDFESQIRRIDIKDITTDFVVYSLDRFLDRFLYKVGDEFCNPYDKITEMFWDEEDEIVYYKTEYSRDYVTTTDIMLDNYARSR